VSDEAGIYKTVREAVDTEVRDTEGEGRLGSSFNLSKLKDPKAYITNKQNFLRLPMLSRISKSRKLLGYLS
jgi:hypothetical protein